MFDSKKMGKQIAHLRIGRNYTQEQLAEVLKVSPQAVSKWENGRAVPEVPMLCEISKLFHCPVDRLLDPSSCVLHEMDFDYEFLVRPRIPAADYSGPEWPKSISAASLLTALKLFFGLEQRRDSKNRQINDDEEYILQSAMTNVRLIPASGQTKRFPAFWSVSSTWATRSISRPASRHSRARKRSGITRPSG